MIYNMTSQAKFTVTDWMGPNINIITAHMILSTSLFLEEGHTKMKQDMQPAVICFFNLLLDINWCQKK